jgi:hypothetical protein
MSIENHLNLVGQITETVPARIPTEAGPDTICECYHWWEEHKGGSPFLDRLGEAGECFAPHCDCQKFVFSAENMTPAEIADRGGDPEKWPDWMKAVL